MTDKTRISGSELQPGMTIKSNGKLYTLISKDEDEDSRFGDLWDVRLSNGETLWIHFFGDSEYELRSAPVRARHRMVKVRAADLEQLLRVASYDVHVPATNDAVGRLREAVAEGTRR